ncbi:hypothetical protein GGI12_001736 [Dipsacomyces acuminosporus]|nr:hypothetical protein GGI12_001736 [Dipsacomyces acuminosporus]
MGVFWPLDQASHVARLLGLVGFVAGVCAVSDRDTRYALLKCIYSQLRQLDESAALEIEQEAQNEITRKIGMHSSDINNARDTRSFASESTAFSRAASPQLHQQTHVYLLPSDASTPLSSALCNTPEAVSQLGEALTKLSHKSLSEEDTERRMLQPPRSSDLNYGQPVHAKAVVASDHGAHLPSAAAVAPAFLPPLLPVLGQSPTPAASSLPSPLAERQQTPKPKAAKDSKARLVPLPNPNAPKIKPAIRDGKPRPFDYTPPVSVPSTPQPQPEKTLLFDGPKRRVRGHVEIETTEHDSYGFVSNPSALVPPSMQLQQQQKQQIQAGAAAEGDHYLFVCVKCQRRNTSEVCENVCSSENGVLRCKLIPRNGMVMDDLEDLVMPMTPKMYTDGRRKTTGRMLYENLQALHSQHERLKSRATCRGAGPHTHDAENANSDGEDPGSSLRECPNAVKSRLKIVPVNCLSMCHLANVVAVSAPGKFGYQFGAMREDDSEDMQAILQFAEDYIESDEGFTKNKTRPPKLSRNILARIPPPLPTFTTVAE